MSNDIRPMTKENCQEQVKELIDTGNFDKFLLEKVDYILDSGMVETANETKDTYALPKILLHCALMELARQYLPPTSMHYAYDRYSDLLELYGEKL